MCVRARWLTAAPAFNAQGYTEADIKEIAKMHQEGHSVPVRKLFLVAERALQESRGKGKGIVECFFKCMLDYGLRR
jgi:hypothetical protein